jgi:hypothetical protein
MGQKNYIEKDFSTGKQVRVLLQLVIRIKRARADWIWKVKEINKNSGRKPSPTAY